MAIRHPDLETVRRPGKKLSGEIACDRKVTQTLLGENPRNDDQAEHHGQYQVEQVVAGIDRRDSDRKAEKDKGQPLFRKTEGTVAIDELNDFRKEGHNVTSG